jgi:hypothetical protein
MSDAVVYGLWIKRYSAWAGLGLGPKFHPFQGSAPEDVLGAGASNDVEVRPFTPEALIDGLPYPDAAKRGARVVVEDGVYAVEMSPSLPWETADAGRILRELGAA